MHSSKAASGKYSNVEDQVLGIPVRLSVACLRSMAPKGYLCDSVATGQLRGRAKADMWHKEVNMGPKIAEKLRRRLSFGARILQEGGSTRIFKRLFKTQEAERLLKACHCSLSTTAGPIAGFLFVSTHKIAFCSERSIKITSPADGGFVRIHYKVSIPLEKIKRISGSTDVKQKSQKYVEMVTVDDYDFWFMGFFYFQKTLRFLQEVIQRFNEAQ